MGRVRGALVAAGLSGGWASWLPRGTSTLYHGQERGVKSLGVHL